MKRGGGLPGEGFALSPPQPPVAALKEQLEILTQDRHHLVVWTIFAPL